MTITTHELVCGCCNGPATATMDGEEFKRGHCANCGTILTMPMPVYDELVRRIRAGAPVADQKTGTFAFHRDLHPDTANLVAAFAGALAAKLHAAQVKYGYSDGWARGDWMDECRRELAEHVAKGDPRDVAAYCAFLWHHGERTAAPSSASAPEVEAWRPMETAPLNGTEVLLLISDPENPLMDESTSVSIGAYGVEGGADADPTWTFAGWNWEQDCYERGVGAPIGWMPAPSSRAAPQRAEGIALQKNTEIFEK